MLPLLVYSGISLFPSASCALEGTEVGGPARDYYTTGQTSRVAIARALVNDPL